MSSKQRPSKTKTVTRFEYDADEPRTPETGHTALLPSGEEEVEVDLGEHWAQHLRLAHLSDDRTMVVDMDPFVDPTLLWAGKNGEGISGARVDSPETQPTLLWSGKRSRRDIPVLPLQRTEIVTASRIAQITARARARVSASTASQGSLFEEEERELRERERETRLRFYTYGETWKNKLICGDSLEVMESLIHYERLGGLVQTIYIDPPYGIRYNANFQQRIDNTRNEEDDGADDVVTVKAFRDTWALGIHTYLTYLRDRLYLSRELLTRSGSVFVQISEANNHLVRAVMDEVFGAENFCSLVTFQKKTMPLGSEHFEQVADYLLWYASSRENAKTRPVFERKRVESDPLWSWAELDTGERRRMTSEEVDNHRLLPPGARVYRLVSMLPAQYRPNQDFPFDFDGVVYHPPGRSCWKTDREGMEGLV